VIIFRVVATFADLFVRGADGLGAVGAVAAGSTDTHRTESLVPQREVSAQHYPAAMMIAVDDASGIAIALARGRQHHQRGL
jgi:hypothetical protein